MPAPEKYSDELRMTRDPVDAGRPGRSGPVQGCFKRIGDELEIALETLRGRVGQARIDVGDRPGATTEEVRRIEELEKEV